MQMLTQEGLLAGGTAARYPRVRRVRVLLALDAPHFRSLMRRRLETDNRFVIVGEASNGAEAVELAEETRPDVAVIDLTMPVMDGLQTIRTMRERVPETKTVLLAPPGAPEAAKAVRSGAHTYLEKGTASSQILTVLAPLAPPEFE